MYNYGILSFLQAKSVNTRKGVNAFLLKEEVKFPLNHHDKVNDYIQKNWNKFATFIDKSIKDGTLQGTAVKLDYYHQEERDRKEIVRKEFEHLNLTSLERLFFKYIKEKGAGMVQGFLQKRGFNTPPKDRSFTSKTLQSLPVLNLLKDNSIFLEFMETINKKEHDK